MSVRPSVRASRLQAAHGYAFFSFGGSCENGDDPAVDAIRAAVISPNLNRRLLVRTTDPIPAHLGSAILAEPYSDFGGASSPTGIRGLQLICKIGRDIAASHQVRVVEAEMTQALLVQSA